MRQEDVTIINIYVSKSEHHNIKAKTNRLNSSSIIVGDNETDIYITFYLTTADYSTHT